MYELINGTQMPIREYNGQRVVTFRDIDNVHHRPDGTAHRNFKANRKHFIECVDFFKVCADEIRLHKIIDLSTKAHEDITLVTLSGYLMISKSFTDEFSWSIQRMLVNSYFIVREQVDDYYILLRRQNELESRLSRIENKLSENRFMLPKKSREEIRWENAEYVLEKLRYSGGNVFTKHTALILCRKLKARELTEVLNLLAENGYISYKKVQTGKRGKPCEIIEIIKTERNDF